MEKWGLKPCLWSATLCTFSSRYPEVFSMDRYAPVVPRASHQCTVTNFKSHGPHLHFFPAYSRSPVSINQPSQASPGTVWMIQPCVSNLPLPSCLCLKCFLGEEMGICFLRKSQDRLITIFLKVFQWCFCLLFILSAQGYRTTCLQSQPVSAADEFAAASVETQLYN